MYLYQVFILTICVLKVAVWLQNSSKGDPVVTIVATDEDEGDNSLVDLAFVTGNAELNGYRNFYIRRDDQPRRNQFTIYQNVTFDRETSTQYKVGELDIHCTFSNE